MSYAVSLPLQEALYARIRNDAALAALIGERIYDEPPHSEDPDAEEGAYITIGDERVEAFDARDMDGAQHELEFAVHSAATGFAEAKTIGGALSDLLIQVDSDPAFTLTRGRLVLSRFISARTVRTEAGGRRIDMRFRFHIQDTA